MKIFLVFLDEIDLFLYFKYNYDLKIIVLFYGEFVIY